jgi:hypothetical protein
MHTRPSAITLSIRQAADAAVDGGVDGTSDRGEQEGEFGPF